MHKVDICPNCRRVYPSGVMKNCLHCQTLLVPAIDVSSAEDIRKKIEAMEVKAKCPNCETSIKPEDAFCPKCNYRLSTPETAEAKG